MSKLDQHLSPEEQERLHPRTRYMAEYGAFQEKVSMFLAMLDSVLPEELVKRLASGLADIAADAFKAGMQYEREGGE